MTCKIAHAALLRQTPLSHKRFSSSCINVDDVYILSGARTPIGRLLGKLSSLSAVQLSTKVLTAAIERAYIAKEDVEEIILGSNIQAGYGQGPAHQVALFAGLSQNICSFSVSKACASGLKAVGLGSLLVSSRAQEVVAVGGVESLSNAPFILKRKPFRWGNLKLHDLILHDGLIDPFHHIDVTAFAEETAKEFNITRKEQDDYTICSYERALRAREENVYFEEMSPVILKKKKGEEDEVVCHDEQIDRLDEEKLRALPPDLGPEGTITAANASGLHDGACMLILASGNYVLKKGLTPLARIVAYSDVSTDTKKFTMAPSVCVAKSLVRANLNKNQITRWEINETFAVTALVNMKIMRIEPERVNVYGGSLSLGHPFGMTGARLVTHLAYTLNPGELGCACISHVPGGASSIIIEKLQQNSS